MKICDPIKKTPSYDVHLLLFDIDGCLFPQQVAELVRQQKEQNLSFDEETVIKAILDEFHVDLFDKIVQELTEKIKKEPDKKIKLIFGSATNRQSKQLDDHNTGSNKTLSAILVWPILQQHLADKIKDAGLQKHIDAVVFDPISISDLYTLKCEPGDTYRAMLAEKKYGKKVTHTPTSFFDETKITLLLMWILHTWNLNRDAEKITIQFFDDMWDILDYIARFFKAFPEMLPSKIMLELQQYNGNGPKLETTIEGQTSHTSLPSWAWLIRYLTPPKYYSESYYYHSDMAITTPSCFPWLGQQDWDIERRHQKRDYASDTGRAHWYFGYLTTKTPRRNNADAINLFFQHELKNLPSWGNTNNYMTNEKLMSWAKAYEEKKVHESPSFWQQITCGFFTSCCPETVEPTPETIPLISTNPSVQKNSQ